MKTIRSIFAILTISLVLVGCSSSSKNENGIESSIVGTWHDNGKISYQFAPDHTGVCNTYGQTMNFMWGLEGNGIVKIEKNGSFFLVQLKDGKLIFGTKIFEKVK